MRAAKRFAVGGQNQDIFRNPVFEIFQRLKPVGKWIRFRLCRKHTYVRRDSRQQLVTGDQQILLAAVQAGMFRGMTLADYDLPSVVADFDLVAVFDAVVGLRRFVNVFAEHAENLVVEIHLLGLESSCLIKTIAFFRCCPAGICNEDSCQQVFIASHPQWHIEFVC